MSDRVSITPGQTITYRLPGYGYGGNGVFSGWPVTASSSSTAYPVAIPPQKAPCRWNKINNTLTIAEGDDLVCYRVLDQRTSQDALVMDRRYEFRLSDGRTWAAHSGSLEIIDATGTFHPPRDERVEALYRTTFTSPPTPPTSKEDDMLRNTFTFTYTGTEIAKAIDVKIKDLKDKIELARKHDLDALIEAGIVEKAKKDAVEATIKGHNSNIERWEKEQRPYAKAGTKTFDLDADDVAHFGL